MYNKLNLDNCGSHRHFIWFKTGGGAHGLFIYYTHFNVIVQYEKMRKKAAERNRQPLFLFWFLSGRQIIHGIYALTVNGHGKMQVGNLSRLTESRISHSAYDFTRDNTVPLVYGRSFRQI
jgi:hypothetical protein